MANHKSAEKRARQNEKRRKRNSAIKSSLRTATKKLIAVVAAGDKDQAQELLKATCREWDKSVSKKIVRSQTADRRKSRLTKRVNDLLSGKLVVETKGRGKKKSAAPKKKAAPKKAD